MTKGIHHLFCRHGALALALLLLWTLALPVSIRAADAFATPQFDRQWHADEATAPNFWGPLATAHEGQTEPYAGNSTGPVCDPAQPCRAVGLRDQRLVQYFDKGRMEITGGIVTNGLLATELVRGQIQVGDASFQPKTPPAIAIAGDADNTTPTYAQLATTASSLLAPASQRGGGVITVFINAQGSAEDGGGFAGISMSPKIDRYDLQTQHNVLGVFARYRDGVGFLTIGNAISEPFRASVTVGGKPTTVLVQVFERRVLTYTASNPDNFKVEMGNIGQHYYQWRYSSQSVASSATGAPPPAMSMAGSPDAEEADLLARINVYRQQNGTRPLALSPTLIRAARWMSGDMAANRRFNHTDSQGRDPFARMTNFGYTANTYKAENIAAGEATAAGTFAQWKGSAGHNMNMLSPHYTVIGIGRVQATPGDPYHWYWTTDFGGESG